MKDLTIILPIHLMDEKTDDLFKNAIKSISTQTVEEKPKLVVVRSNDNKVKDYIESFDFTGLEVEVLENTEDTSFMGQINFAVDKINWIWYMVIVQGVLHFLELLVDLGQAGVY